MMELAITNYLKLHGLEKTIEDFKLRWKDYPHKVSLRYDSIESNLSLQECQDARGLVLEKGTWKVMSLAFRKFFNQGEGRAAQVDWANARVFQKMDGTMIQVYYDWVTKEWCFGTTGTAEGEGDVDNFHHTGGNASTFGDLFWEALKATATRSGIFDKLNINSPVSEFGFSLPTPTYFNRSQVFEYFKGYTLAFELCTPYNIVVTPHQEMAVYLLGGRNLTTGEELPFNKLERIADGIGVPMAPTVAIGGKTPEELIASFEGMPYTNEGYIVCDENFNRVKIKNPAYVAVHFIKDSTAFWRVIDIVRSGETDEFVATFPGRKEEIESLKFEYDNLVEFLNDKVAEMRSWPEYTEFKRDMTLSKELASVGPFAVEPNKELRKHVALRIQSVCGKSEMGRFSALLYKNMSEPVNVKEYLMIFDGKDLYEILNAKAKKNNGSK